MRRVLTQARDGLVRQVLHLLSGRLLLKVRDELPLDFVKRLQVRLLVGLHLNM